MPFCLATLKLFGQSLSGNKKIAPKHNASKQFWCRWRESNPHGGLAQRILSPPRLPVPTHRRAKRPPISGLHKLLYRMNRKKAIEKRNFFGEKLARKWCRNSPLFMLKCKLNLCGIVSVVPPMPFCLSKSEST